MKDRVKEWKRRASIIKLLPNEPRGSSYSSPRGSMAIRTMDEVAKIMGISKGRVHQLERTAFYKIRIGLSS